MRRMFRLFCAVSLLEVILLVLVMSGNEPLSKSRTHLRQLNRQTLLARQLPVCRQLLKPPYYSCLKLEA